MPPPPFDTVLTGLQQIDLDLNHRLSLLLSLATAYPTQFTQDLVRVATQAGAVSLASIDTKLTAPLVTKPAGATTGTLTNVGGSASSVTLLAANANRKGATIFNDSSATLSVKFGATASATSFTVQLVSGAYYEVPYGYTGILDGIWTSATGNARVTEVT